MSHPSAIRRLLSVVGPPLLLSTLAAVACQWAAGWTLGIFIGGLVLVTLTVPPASLADSHWSDRLTSLVAALAPFCLLWLVAARKTDTQLVEWTQCAAVLVAYGLALAGLAGVLRVCRLSATVSAALTIILGLAWLTWPIWLSRVMSGQASAEWVGNAVTVHPGLSINLPHLGQWVEQSVAYHLTDLNQNVSYAPPRSVWKCVAFHAVIGAVLLGLSFWKFPRPPRLPRPVQSAGNEPAPVPAQKA